MEDVANKIVSKWKEIIESYSIKVESVSCFRMDKYYTGKFCWHWGNKHHAAQYTTKVEVENSEIEIGKTNHKVGDTIQVIKTLVFDEKKKIVDTRYSIK